MDCTIIALISPDVNAGSYTNWKTTSIGSFPALNQFCVIIRGRPIQLFSLGSITDNYKILIYICSRRNRIFTRLIKVPDPKTKFSYTEGTINEFST